MLMNENIMERLGENHHFFRMILQYYFNNYDIGKDNLYMYFLL